MNFDGIRFFYVLAFLSVGACQPTLEPVSPTGEAGPMAIEKDVAVPMRDGVILRADVYRPAGAGPFPVLVYRTPYGKHEAVESYETHRNAVDHGYAVVLQDVRGRYASDGLFEPYRNEGRDGYDTIQWASRQSWSNGKVGTFGLSYPGAVQWLAALEKPPALVAMAPAMTFSSPGNFFYMNGVFDLSWLPWIYFNIAPDARIRQDLPGIRSWEEASEAWDSVADEYLLHVPLAELPYLQAEAPYYFEWLKHPPDDPWWNWSEVRGRYADTGAAVLNMSGWYDEAYGPEGAITNHNGLVASRSGSSRSHLIMGPWKHGVIETGERLIGDVDFGPDAGIDYDRTLLRFFDQYLRNQETGLSDEAPVHYFLMGSNEWREAQKWPPEYAMERDWCLSPGALKPCSEWSPSDPGVFTADPGNPVTDPYDSFGPHDYRELDERKDVLTFDSDVLEEDLSIAGNVTARVSVSCDCQDFDLWFRLYDVYPDGRVINLRSPGAEVLRVSYRDIDQGHQPLVAGEVYEVEMDYLMMANTFRAGHRVRAMVSASFSPHLSRNLQTGESEHFSAEYRVADISIHHSETNRSTLTLPVISP